MNFSKMSDLEFLEFLKDPSIYENPLFFKNKEISSRLLELNNVNLLKIGLIDSKLLLYILDKELLLKTDDNRFSTVILRTKSDVKKELLSNHDIAYRVITSPKNRMKRNIFNLLGEQDANYQNIILNNKEVLSRLDDNQMKELYQSLDKEKINLLNTNLKDTNIEFKEGTLLNQISLVNKGKLNINELKEKIKTLKNIKNDELINQFLILVSQKKRDIFSIYQILDDTELLLYNSFNVIIKDKDLFKTPFNPQIESNLKNYQGINEDILKLCSLNNKQITSLVDLLNAKEKQSTDEMTLKVALNLYCLFGFDLSRKIITDFFTYQTAEGINKASNLAYNQERRNFRLEHQDMFYNDLLVNKLLDNLEVHSKDILYDLFDYKGNDYVLSIYRKYMNNLSFLEKKEAKKAYLVKALKEDIEKREDYLKTEYIDNYKEKNTNKRPAIFTKELYRYFENVDYRQIKIDSKGNVVLNENLLNFLFGNQKKNNDCFLRLFFNNQVNIEKDVFIEIINSFSIIEQIVKNSNQQFSLNSILDVMDIYRSIQYDLLPNEYDLSLETLSKVIHSREHCSLKTNELILEVKRLHQLQKRKCSSSIPCFVQGESRQGVKYRVIDFDSDKIFAIGNKVNCFKVGAKGEAFLKYCLLDKNALVVELFTESSYHFAEIIRNGNGIFVNGIDPELKDKQEERKILNALVECVQEIMDYSIENEKIEFCTITNLHNFGDIDALNLPIYDMKENPAYDTTFYADYAKEEYKNYILTTNVKNPTFKPYYPKYQYYQPRTGIFSYNEDISYLTKLERQDIENMINSILYTNIDVNDIDNKNEEKEMFDEKSRIVIDDFSYVIGNKDWFYGMHKTKGILMAILPFDPRAKQEFDECLLKRENKLDRRIK